MLFNLPTMTASSYLTCNGCRPYFSGEENKYLSGNCEKTKFLGYMRLQKIHSVFKGSEEPTESNNALAYAQLIKYLDDTSLNLIIREEKDDKEKH